MGGVLFFLALFLALFGIYCLLDFLYVRVSGRVVDATVTGFSTKKDKGRRLPVAEYRDEAGELRKQGVTKIDQISYLFSPAIEREIISIVLLPDGKARVYGYLKLVCGVVLLLPLLAVAGGARGGAFLTGQVVYIFLFIAVTVGGLGILRAISRMR